MIRQSSSTQVTHVSTGGPGVEVAEFAWVIALNLTAQGVPWFAGVENFDFLGEYPSSNCLMPVLTNASDGCARNIFFQPFELLIRGHENPFIFVDASILRKHIEPEPATAHQPRLSLTNTMQSHARVRNYATTLQRKS